MDNPSEAKHLVFNLGSVDRIPAGQGLSYVVCGHEIAVFRQRDDHVFATQNRCPHKQGSLAEGILGGGTAGGATARCCADHRQAVCLKSHPFVNKSKLFLRQLAVLSHAS